MEAQPIDRERSDRSSIVTRVGPSASRVLCGRFCSPASGGEAQGVSQGLEIDWSLRPVRENVAERISALRSGQFIESAAHLRAQLLITSHRIADQEQVLQTIRI
jgi:hypothetical protein